MALNLMEIDRAVADNRSRELAQKMNLRNMLRMDKQDAQLEQTEGAYRGAIGEDGSVNPQELVRLLSKANPMQAYEVKTQFDNQEAARAKQARETQTADLDYKVKLGKYARDTVASATPETWQSIKQQLVQQGVKSAETLPDEYSPDAHRAYIMQADDWLKQNAPKEVKIGQLQDGTVYDANNPTGITIGQNYSKPEKAPAQPAAVQEYEYAKGQGYNGTFQQYQSEQKTTKKTGLSATAQKELFEADETVEGSKAAIGSFKQALALNKQAMGGFGSGALATAGSVLPDFARPDTVDATKELDNILQNAALPQLKAIFGGMPTEGERAILLEVQGSSAQPAKVREGIFNRAIAAANKRIQVNADKAKRLRAGTYFSDDGETMAEPTAPKPATGGKSKVVNGVTYINDGKGWKKK
jgi:hypothetical protein